MKPTPRYLARIAIITLVLAACQIAGAANIAYWIATNSISATTNWSDLNNWTNSGAGSAGPAFNNVVFGDTNTVALGVTNSVVDTSTTVSTLTFSNTVSGQSHNLYIPGGSVLTCTNTATLGVTTAGSGLTTTVTMSGPGEFDENGNMNIGVASTGSGTGNATLDLSGLNTFSMNTPASTLAIGSVQQINGTMSLASNSFINVAAINIEVTGGKNGRTGFLNLGAVTNTLEANTFQIGQSKASSTTVRFPGTTGSVTITGTGGSPARSTLTLGFDNSGTAAGTGNLLLAGHPATVLVSTLTLGERGNTGGSPDTGNVTFDNGTFDATSIIMGWVTSGTPGSGTVGAAGNFTIGGNTNASATLLVNAPSGPGGGTFILGRSGTTGSSGSGNFTILGNGTALVYCDIVKSNSPNSVATIINGGTLFMFGGNIGSLAAPIDNLTLSNSVLTLETIAPTTTNVVVGVLTTDPSSTTNVVTIDLMPGITSYPASFPLIAYQNPANGISGNGFNIGISNLPPIYTAYLTNDTTSDPNWGLVKLVVLSGPIPEALTWNGNAGGNWNTSEKDWLHSGAPTNYNQGDFVTFDDTASGATTVNLSGELTPNTLTINNTAKAYTFAGSGGLGGVTGLTKQGANSLVLDNSGANTFIGPVVISAGTLQVGNADGNGSLGSSPITDSGTLVFNRNNAANLPNALSGGGGLTQNGTGTLTISGGNSSFTGTVSVAQGTLKLGSPVALGTTNSGTTIASGATIDFAGFPLTNISVTASGTGVGSAGGIINSGASIFPAVSRLTLVNNTTFGGSGRWDLRSPNIADPTGASLSTGGNAYNIIKTGTNTVSIVGTTVDPALGNIDVQQGLFSVESATTSLGNPASTVTVRAGATLQLFNLTNQLNKMITLNGDGTTTTLNNGSGVNTIIGAITLNGSDIINAGGTSLTLAGAIGGAPTSVTKYGGAYLILSGANTYTGATIITNGTFALNGINGGGGLLTNFPNSTIVGTGTNTGPVTISGTLNPGDVGVAGTFTVGSLTALTGAGLAFDLSSVTTTGGGVNDLLQVNGNLVLNNTTVTINPFLGTLAAGTYTLITYTGSLTGSFNPAVQLSTGGSSRDTLTLDTSTAGQVKLIVGGSAGRVKWASTADPTWDVATTPNWFNLGTSTADDFFQLDSVLLDDSVPGVQSTLNLTTNVSPFMITNNASLNDFAIVGPGHITGPGGIVKMGTDTLMLGSANTFQGTVTVLSGTLQVTNNGALGATNGGTIIANGATLDVMGPPTVNALNLGAEQVTVSGWGVNSNGAIINSGSGLIPQENALEQVVLVGDTAFGGPGQFLIANGTSGGRWDMRGGTPVLSTGGHAYNLFKVGNNQVSLVGVAVDPALANIDIQSGELGFENSTTSMGNPANTLTVEPGAQLEVFQSGGNTNYYTKQFVFNGDGVSTNFYNGSGATTLNGNMSLSGGSVFGSANGTTTTNNCTVSGSGGFTAVGSTTANTGGNYILTAVNTYTGPTTVNGGALFLIGSGSIANSSSITLASGKALDVTGRSDGTLTLSSGQTLAGSGTVRGNVNAPAGSVTVVGDSVGNVLTVTTNLTLNNNSNAFSVVTGIGDSLLAVSNNITLNGTVRLFVAPSGPVSVGQTFTIMQYGGTLTGNEGNLQVYGSPGFAFAAVPTATTPGTIQVQATSVPVTTYWRGSTGPNGTLWDTTTFNWTQDFSTPTNFANGQFAVFDDSGVTNLVRLVGSIRALDTTFQNNSLAYTLAGSGKLTGDSTVTVIGIGLVVIDNSGSNDYSGHTAIYNGGTVQVGNGDANGNLGQGSILLTNSNLAFDRTDNVDLQNDIFGTLGTVTNLGTGVLTLSGNNGMGASVTVAAGTLRINNNNALGGTNAPVNPSGNLFVQPGATLDLGGPSIAANVLNLSNEVVSVSGAGVGGKGAIINTSTNQQQNALRNVVLAGDTWFGGIGIWNPVTNFGRWDIRGAVNTASLSTGSQPFNLFKTGSNQVSLVSIAIDATPQASLANIDIQQGLLGFEANTTSMGDPSSNLTVRAGATMSFFNTTNHWNKVFVFYGDGVDPTVTNWSGNNTMIGAVTLNGSVVFAGDSGSLTNTGNISGSGSLLKTGASRLVLSGTNSYTGNTVVKGGLLQLIGASAVSASPLFDIVGPGTNSILDLTQAGGVLNVGSSQTAQGAGIIWGSLNVSGSGAVSVGEPNLVGTLLATNTITLGPSSTTSVKLNLASANTNDVLRAAAGLTLGGTLNVVNIGPALSSGDTFTLFSGITGGTINTNVMPSLAPGLFWDTSALNSAGRITVAGTGVPPKITSSYISQGKFIVSGTGGVSGATCRLLNSTNVNTPLTNWSVIATGTFDANGNFAFTNPISGPRSFYLLQVPPH